MKLVYSVEANNPGVVQTFFLSKYCLCHLWRCSIYPFGNSVEEMERNVLKNFHNICVGGFMLLAGNEKPQYGFEERNLNFWGKGGHLECCQTLQAVSIHCDHARDMSFLLPHVG